MEADLYVRISHDPTGQQAGVQRQEAECRSLCERLGLTVREVFTDNDISATSGVARPAFERLLRAQSPVIVAWHMDRLIRLSKDLELVLNLGVNVHTVVSGHLDLATPAGRAVARTVTAWAQYEGEQKAERQKASHRQRARQGRPWWPTGAFGFNRDGTHREDEAEHLRRAYEDVLVGKPIAQIARDLADAGVRSQHGNVMAATTVRSILMSPRNAGILSRHGEEIGPGAWEPIVPETTWRNAVRMLDHPSRKNGGGGSRQALLSGVVFCAPCLEDEKGPSKHYHRSPTLGQTRRRDGERVYGCRASHQIKVVAELNSVVASVALARMTLDHPYKPFRFTAKADPKVAALEAEGAELRERVAGLAEDIATVGNAFVRERVMEALDRAAERLSAIDALLSEASGPDLPGGVSGTMTMAEVADQFFDLDVNRQRKVIQHLLPRIVVHPRGRGKRGWRSYEVQFEVSQWCPDDDMGADVAFGELVRDMIPTWAEARYLA